MSKISEQAPVIITGGAQRFGLALASALADEGHNVVISYRSEKESLAGLQKKGVQCLQADFSSPAGINTFLQTLRSSYPCIRALIHNASDWIPEKSPLLFEEVLDKSMAVHVMAPYMLNLGLEDNLRACSEAGQAADIIHMTDFVAATGSKKHIAYAASKAALENLTLSFASRFAPHIKVNSIAPALLMFNDHDDEQYRLKARNKSLLPPAPGAAEGIRAVKFLLESEYITGRSIALDGGRHLVRK